MKRHHMLISILLGITLIALVLAFWTSVGFPGSGKSTPEKPAGFLDGFVHGSLIGWSLLFGLFKDTAKIYEPNNTGWWYDLGYVLAVFHLAAHTHLPFSKKKVE